MCGWPWPSAKLPSKATNVRTRLRRALFHVVLSSRGQDEPHVLLREELRGRCHPGDDPCEVVHRRPAGHTEGVLTIDAATGKPLGGQLLFLAGPHPEHSPSLICDQVVAALT